jgi:hypothetical protein
MAWDISRGYIIRSNMSQMPPFLRGYRHALRDVQRAVLVYHQTMPVHASARAAVSAAADSIFVPLRRLRETDIVPMDESGRGQI